MSVDVVKARRVFEATRFHQFSDIPPLDFSDRVSLLTVAAGLRQLGVLEGDGLALNPIRDAAISTGLFTTVRNGVWSRSYDIPDGPLAEPLRLLYEFRGITPRKEKVLWLFQDAQVRSQYKSVDLSKEEAGLALSYPTCCVKAGIDSSRERDTAFLKALIAEVGSDPKAVGQALWDDVKITLDQETVGLQNVQATSTLYPFVMHVACESCLQDSGSPTAMLNQRYGQLVAEVDADLHNAIVMTFRIEGETDFSDDVSAIRGMELISGIHSRLFKRPR